MINNNLTIENNFNDNLKLLKQIKRTHTDAIKNKKKKFKEDNISNVNITQEKPVSKKQIKFDNLNKLSQLKILSDEDLIIKNSINDFLKINHNSIDDPLDDQGEKKIKLKIKPKEENFNNNLLSNIKGNNNTSPFKESIKFSNEKINSRQINTSSFKLSNDSSIKQKNSNSTILTFKNSRAVFDIADGISNIKKLPNNKSISRTALPMWHSSKLLKGSNILSRIGDHYNLNIKNSIKPKNFATSPLTKANHWLSSSMKNKSKNRASIIKNANIAANQQELENVKDSSSLSSSNSLFSITSL